MLNNYNPDVLSCIANLSNDEIFTPPNLAIEMLDLLPAELWSDPNATFLDPVTKSGVFLREITKRLIVGLESQIPDLQERINHILTKQVFGIAITELTSLLTRRSVYCSKIANHEKYSICTDFNDEQGNISFKNIQHTFLTANGKEATKCLYCGASKAVYDRGDTAETYAYNFIHTENPTTLFKQKNMRFDVIIGNPPYHLSDGSGGSSDSATPIYNKFIEQAQKLSPRYLLMIIPSKWMVGGRGLDKFREKMMIDTKIKYIYDFENSMDCFQGINLDGGVCYFLWDKDYDGLTEYTFRAYDGSINQSKKSLKNDFFQYVIRDNRILSMIEKTSKGKRFSEIVSSRKPFGIETDLFNVPDKYPELNLQFQQFDKCLKVYGVKGIKGGAKRTIGFVSEKFVTDSFNAINQYKLFFSKTYSTGAINPPEIIAGMPDDICTSTFLMIGGFKDELNQQNCLSYMKTSFFKILLYFGKGTMNVTKSVFDLIPLQDFSKPWTDEELYVKYGLNEEEIAFIESMIKPME